MILMALGYYSPIVSEISAFIKALLAFDMDRLLHGFAVLIPVMKTSPVILRQIDNMNPFHSRTYIFCNNPDRIKGCRNQKSLLLFWCD